MVHARWRGEKTRKDGPEGQTVQEEIRGRFIRV